MLLVLNKNPMCGMFQLAKDMDGDIYTLRYNNPFYRLFPFLDRFDYSAYDEVITFLYPMHLFGKKAKKQGKRFIVYDQGVPPIHLFKNFFRRQSMKWLSYVNKKSMQGADEYWDVTEREQKPRWTEKIEPPLVFQGYRNKWFSVLSSTIKWDYALYVGRKTDYKNFEWLDKTMNELEIPFVTPPDNCDDGLIHSYYSGAKLFVTASTWEGWGRPVNESESLGIPAVSFDTGAHKKNTKKGICVENNNFDALQKAIKTVWERETK